MRIHGRSSAIRAALAMIACTMPLPLHAQTAAPATGTAKGEGEKLKVDISFNAPFGKPPAVKK